MDTVKIVERIIFTKVELLINTINDRMRYNQYFHSCNLFKALIISISRF